jgi:hypothetical protein
MKPSTSKYSFLLFTCDYRHNLFIHDLSNLKIYEYYHYNIHEVSKDNFLKYCIGDFCPYEFDLDSNLFSFMNDLLETNFEACSEGVVNSQEEFDEYVKTKDFFYSDNDLSIFNMHITEFTLINAFLKSGQKSNFIKNISKNTLDNLEDLVIDNKKYGVLLDDWYLIFTQLGGKHSKGFFDLNLDIFFKIMKEENSEEKWYDYMGSDIGKLYYDAIYKS